MKKLVLAAVLLGATAAPAAAVTIDFQELQGNCTPYGVSLDSQGYRFTTPDTLWSCEGTSVGVATSSKGLVGYTGGEISMSRIDGSAFALRSLFTGDAAGFNSGTYGVSAIGMLLGGGSVSTLLSFSGSAFQQYVLPTDFDNLISVSFKMLTSGGSADLLLIDDVVAEDATPSQAEAPGDEGEQTPQGEPEDEPEQASGPQATAVPEPGVVGLLGLGTLVIGFARRRRRAR